MDKLTPEQRHRNMSKIKSKDTKIEIKLRKALWNKGYRYQKNSNELPGKPDIVLSKYQIAIFCDSEFFHGKDWDKLKEQLAKSSNSDFWIDKLHKNVMHDDETDKQLKGMGWTVIRFWGKDITKNVDDCVKAVEEVIFDLKIQESED